MDNENRDGKSPSPGLVPARKLPAALDKEFRDLVGDVRYCHSQVCLFTARAARCFHGIRSRLYPDQAAFCWAVGEVLGDIVHPAKAWDLANLWEGARKDRRLLMLTNDAPEEARALVRTFTAAWATDAKTLTAAELDEHEQEFDKVLRMSRKERGTWMREAKAARDAARDGRSPKDIARIDELEAEKKALEAARPDSLAQQRNAATEKAQACANALEVAVREAVRLGADTYPKSLRGQMLALHDQVFGIADALEAIGAGEKTEEPES